MNNNYKWTVVGAGAAGIAAVAKLLDSGISSSELLWIDPDFGAGDLGKHWSNVSSNTKVKLFNAFLDASTEFADIDKNIMLNSLDPEKTCKLMAIVEPLQIITHKLASKVKTTAERVKSLSLNSNLWHLDTEDNKYCAQNVILATGAEPKSLNYPVAEISFIDAIDRDKLAAGFDVNATYAVFGSSHSAFIVIRNLVELGAKQVINFYRSPCKYAVDMGDWILFDNTGLKGETATWTRENIDGKLPNNLSRYIATEENINKYLPNVDHAIYAVGFKPRNNIKIADYTNINHNPRLGILAPGLFGLGIGYPELKQDKFGNIEHQVGLWKFMQYLNTVLPVWMKYGVRCD